MVGQKSEISKAEANVTAVDVTIAIVLLHE